MPQSQPKKIIASGRLHGIMGTKFPDMAQTLGQKLCEARERRGLSLLDAAHRTRVPVHRLMQLERDNYAAFGSMTYARAFLRLYSEFLQVDAAEMLEDLPPGVLGGARDYRYLVEAYGPWVSAPGSPHRLAPPSFRRTTVKSHFSAGMLIFGSLLVVSWMWGSYVAGEGARHQDLEVGTAAAAASTLPLTVTEPFSEMSDQRQDGALVPMTNPASPPPKAIPLSEAELEKLGISGAVPRAQLVNE